MLLVTPRGLWSRSLAAIGLVVVVLGARPASQPSPQDAWPAVARIVAVGDLHGDYDQFVTILRDAALVDAETQWTGGAAHLVQLGDVLDRGPDSRRIMDLLMRLERDAIAAGGRVHALIGNHETMNVYGDLHDVSPGEFEAFRDAGSVTTREAFYERYVDQMTAASAAPVQGDAAFRQRFEAQFPLGYVEHRRAFAADGPYGRWIRGHDAVVKIGDSLFLHGGISPAYLEVPIREINDRIRQELTEASRLRDVDVLQASIIGDPDGPLWYRALVNQPEADLAAHVDAVLEQFDVRRIVVGHTVNLGTVMPRFGGKVLSIDVGLSSVYGGPPASLLIEQGTPYALHRGEQLDLRAASAGGLMEFLRRAAELEPDGSPFRRRIDALGR
jgi:hypothetical protein